MMLLFYVGSACYALDADPVLEIIPKVKFKPIPHAPDYIVGFITYNGIPVPVVDLPQIIEHRPSSPAMHSRIIIVEIGEPGGQKQLLGLIGEKMTETLEIDPKHFIDSGVRVKDLPFLGGVYTREDKSIQLFLLDELFKILKSVLTIAVK